MIEVTPGRSRDTSGDTDARPTDRAVLVGVGGVVVGSAVGGRPVAAGADERAGMDRR
ncbi:MAG: hypothetical protein L0K86_05195 [Actinomycetia bacterium]|nr:hypothetical protein [Actinomycetes bacterium]